MLNKNLLNDEVINTKNHKYAFFGVLHFFVFITD